MASVLSHAVVAYGVNELYAEHPYRRRCVLLSAVVAVLPDGDAIGYFMGIPYDSAWGHRGASHSIAFALLVALVVSLALFPRYLQQTRSLVRVFCVVALAGATHGVLDAMTDGGLGIALFWPIDNHRYFLSWRPLVVSPIGVRAFFSAWGLNVVASELLYVIMPTAVFVLICRIVRRSVT